MRKLDQTIMDAGKGNALQACIASYFDCDAVDDVPNFIADPGKQHYLQSINTWLSLSQHPDLAFVKFELDNNRLTFPTRSGTLVLVAGASPRGDFKHVALARVEVVGADDDDGERLGFNFKIVHDPFPGAVPPYLMTFEWVGMFVKHA